MKELLIRADGHLFLDGEDSGVYPLGTDAIWKVDLGVGMLAELRPSSVGEWWTRPKVAVIPSFTGIHHFLSNGHEGDPFTMHVIVEGFGCDREYLTGEHAYQACKAKYDNQHDWVRVALKPFGPDGAKKRGRQVVALDDWDALKIGVMRNVLDHKFAEGTHLAQQLIYTGDAELIEGNDWGDQFWGVSEGFGHNWLGTLLMARRAVLRSRIPH